MPDSRGRYTVRILASVIVAMAGTFALLSGGCPGNANPTAPADETVVAGDSDPGPANAGNGGGGASEIDVGDAAVAGWMNQSSPAVLLSADQFSADLSFEIAGSPTPSGSAVIVSNPGAGVLVVYTPLENFVGDAAVNVTVTNGSADNRDVLVRFRVLPHVGFALDRYQGESPAAVLATASVAAGFSLPADAQLHWSFGDGHEAIDPVTTLSHSHTFGNSGTYLVSLALTLSGVSSALTCPHANAGAAMFTATARMFPTNEAPVARAGQDLAVLDNDGDGFAVVSLDGRGSSDSDGQIVSYEWQIAGGARIGPSAAPLATVSLPVGAWDVSLTVMDDDGASSSDALRVTISAPSQMALSPGTAFRAAGIAGGPFTPGSAAYTLTNNGNTAVTWSAAPDAAWMTVSPSGGSLAAGASANVMVALSNAANSLAPGTHIGSVIFSNLSNGSGNTARAVELTVTAPSDLAVVPTSDFSASGVVSGPFTPSSQVYVLTNNGGVPLDWTAAHSENWVSLSASSGSLAPAESVSLTVSINSAANSLAAGTYNDTISFTNTTRGLISIRDIRLSVVPPGGILVAPGSNLNSSGLVGGPFSPSSATYTISNTGGAPVNWTATKTRPWVGLSAAGGTLAPGAFTSVVVSINSGANSLAAGSYSDTVTFTNTTNGMGDTTRGVSLTVNAPASLAVTPAGGLTSSGVVGGPFAPSSLTYTLTNNGGVPLNWTATKTRSWVTLSAASGTLAAGGSTAVTVSINSGANSLAAGSYSDTVSFNNSTNGLGNTTRPVSLTVNPPASLTVTPAGGLTSSGVVGGPFSPSALTYTLTNNGGVPLNWTASGTQLWVSLSTAGGTLAAGASTSVTVSINSGANSLAAGNYGDTVTFNNTTNGVGNTTRAVSLTVYPPSGSCITSSTTWQNSSFASQSGVFTVHFDVIPGANNMTGHTILSLGPVSSYSGCAVLVGLGPSGAFDARNGGAYSADAVIPYTAGAIYHVRVVVNVPAHTYSVYITPPSGTETQLAANYAFRTEQSSVASLDNWGASALSGSHQVCNFSLAGGLSVTPVSGLTSSGNPGGPFSPNSQAYTLSNTASQPINWTATKTQSWVTLSGAGGTLGAGASTTVTVSINSGANSLGAGTYNDTVTFTNTTDGMGSTTRAVTLTVNGPPNLAVTPAGGWSSSGNEGGPFSPSSQNYTLTNSGGMSLDWTATRTQTWVTLSPTGGTLAAEASTTVTVSINNSANALAEGSYNDTVTFSNTTNGAGNTTRAVALTVSEGGSSLPMTTASRTSGVAPLAVFFDAVNTTSPAWSSGVVQPGDGDYASFYYAWDFGDPASSNWATDGRSKNAAIGYVAAHLYENPGTYISRLTITDANGQSHQYQQQIVVQAFSGTTYYVSSSSGNDSNNGLTPGTAFQSFNRAMTALGTNRRILFKRGDTWTISNGVILNVNGPGTIGAYYNSDGSDNPAQPKPRITHTGNGRFFTFNAGNDDWRLIDLSLTGAAGSTSGAIFYSSGTQARSLCLRLAISGVFAGFESFWTSTIRAENFVVECDTSNMGSNAGGNHYFVYGFKMAIMGCTGYDVQLDGEHIVRMFHARKTYIASNDFGRPAPSKHALKLHNDIGINPPPPTGRYINISHNTFVGSGWIVSIGPQNASYDEHVEHILLDSNFVSATPDGTVFQLAASHVTARNNVIVGTGAAQYFYGFWVAPRGVEGNPDTVRIHNNTLYHSGNGSEFVMLLVSDSTNVSFVNNLASGPNWTGYERVLVRNVQNLPIDNRTNLLTSAPGFVNAASGNFRLAAGSPAIDQGSSNVRVRSDCDGVARPQGSSLDLGGYERPN